MWGVPKRRLYKKPKSRKMMMEVGSESRSRIVDDDEEGEGDDDVLVMVEDDDDGCSGRRGRGSQNG